jgi:hypothetical protein
LAFNFNNDSRTIPVQTDEVAPASLDSATLSGSKGLDALSDSRRAGEAGGQVAIPAPAEGATPAAMPSAPPQSPAFARFASCRWQQPAEEGNAAFCTHREVKPYAGTTGFDADAWCPDCQYYKLRRAPKKRSPQDEYTY